MTEASTASRQRRRRERGASTVEYGLIVVSVAVVLVGGAKVLGTTLSTEYTNTCQDVATYDGDTCG